MSVILVSTPWASLMDHWRIFVPSHLAYGTRGAGKTIGPNEALIFDLDLIAIR